MNLTREQIIELRDLLSQWEEDVEGSGEALSEKLMDVAPSLIETAEWARNTIEMIVKEGLVPRENPGARLP